MDQEYSNNIGKSLLVPLNEENWNVYHKNVLKNNQF